MEEIIKTLVEFDRARNWNNYDNANTNEEKLSLLYKDIVNLLGELGEFANEVKKCNRDSTWNEGKLKEELADSFIFLMKISFTLKMDLKKEVLRKVKINEERFIHFKKQKNDS